MDLSCSDHLSEILQHDVADELAKKSDDSMTMKQGCEVSTRTFSKKLYFNPGWPKEEEEVATVDSVDAGGAAGGKQTEDKAKVSPDSTSAGSKSKNGASESTAVETRDKAGLFKEHTNKCCSVQ